MRAVHCVCAQALGGSLPTYLHIGIPKVRGRVETIFSTRRSGCVRNHWRNDPTQRGMLNAVTCVSGCIVYRLYNCIDTSRCIAVYRCIRLQGPRDRDRLLYRGIHHLDTRDTRVFDTACNTSFIHLFHRLPIHLFTGKAPKAV